jgi:hypothetical protein
MSDPRGIFKVFLHFRERLIERYGLDISFEEYKDLCKAEIERFKPVNGGKTTGIVSFKGNNIIVAKRAGKKSFLTTALPIDYYRTYANL